MEAGGPEMSEGEEQECKRWGSDLGFEKGGNEAVELTTATFGVRLEGRPWPRLLRSSRFPPPLRLSHTVNYGRILAVVLPSTT